MVKLLAIDDTPDNLISITAVLKYFIPDCTVLTATSGSQGLEIAKKQQPDTVLLDIKMPEMDGFETCRRLKADETTCHIPVILITAIKTDSSSRVKGLQIGADAFLSKPIDEAELTSQVHVMLRIKKAEDLLRTENEQLEHRVTARTLELIKKNQQLANEIEERKKAEDHLQSLLEEKKVLLKEVHHRVKNNLAIISSFLALQARSLADKGMEDLFLSSRNRIKSMALVHEQLYRSDNLKEIDVTTYIGKLVDSLLASFGLNREKIKVTLDILPLRLNLDRLITLGMFLNEVISNSLKHAFTQTAEPALTIRLSEKALGQLDLLIEDNGSGNLAKAPSADNATIGMLLINGLAQQLGAVMKIENIGKTVYQLSFPRTAFD